MGFSNRRVPATRLGSGDNCSIARLRRHVTKGFSDDLPAAGSDIVNNINQFPDGQEKWFNLWEKVLTLSEAENLNDPDFAGQVLMLTLDDSNGGTATWTLQLGKITDGVTDFTDIVFNADGENILLIGGNRLGVLRWFVVANHGGALS